MYSNTKNTSDLHKKILTSLEEVDHCLPAIIDAALYHAVSSQDEDDAIKLYNQVRYWFLDITPAKKPDEYLSNLSHLIAICNQSNQNAASRELTKLRVFLSNNMVPFSKILAEFRLARLFTGIRDNYLNN